MKKVLLFALSTFAMSANAWEPSFYAGSNLASSQLETNAYQSNFTIKSLEGVGGVVLLPHISVEGRLGVGLGEDQERVKLDYNVVYDDEGEVVSAGWTKTDNAIGVKVNYYGSVYFRPFIGNEKATLFGLLGYTTLQVDQSELQGTDPVLFEDDSEGGVSYGFGFTYKMSEHVNFTAEWKKILNADDFDIRGGSAGFTYQF